MDDQLHRTSIQDNQYSAVTICGKIRMQVRLVHPHAKIPYKCRNTDVGYDIYSVQDAILAPGTATLIETGICIAAPPGYYYTIEGRSSLWRKGIFPNRGIIDSTFCGELEISLVNVNQQPYKVSSGDRIAQIIVHKQHDAEFTIVKEFDAMYNQRGCNGFGSTGR